MPLVDVTHDRTVAADALRRLAAALPSVVAAAVDCPQEPWTGPPQPGDIEIRFRERSDHDVGELACVVEVRTKRFQSRVDDAQRRADLLRDGIAGIDGLGPFGVWLILSEGAWSQT